MPPPSCAASPPGGRGADVMMSRNEGKINEPFKNFSGQQKWIGSNSRTYPVYSGSNGKYEILLPEKQA
jgi:hypothetical protein